jgi:hypothetical protein
MKDNQSDAVKEAIRNMPVNWDNDRQRTDYILQHANKFLTSYRTHKTNIGAEFDDIENARRAAKFALAVWKKTGMLRVDRGAKVAQKVGIKIVAVLGDYEAVVEEYHPDVSGGTHET